MSTKTTLETDIVIVGAGPVGLAMACRLASTSLKVAIVDAGPEPLSVAELKGMAEKPQFDPRVSALTVASQTLLDSLGAWDLIRENRACPYHRMEVWDGDGTGSINFSAADIHAESLGHIVENRLINAALSHQADSIKGLKIIRPESVEEFERSAPGDGPGNGRIYLNLAGGGRIAATLLIGADGSNSLIREQAGFKTRQWDYGHQAIVTTVKTALPHQYTAWQRFMTTGPLAFLPLYLPGKPPAEQRYSSIVWSCVTEEAEGLKSLDDDAFRPALGEAFEFRLGEILESDRRFSFPLWQKHATDYVQDNVALIGDAAHTIHPLAGQGVNLGLADVQALSEVISAALDRGEDIGSHQVLSRYQRRRKGHNLGMMAMMESFKRVFGSDDLGIRWLRNSGLSAVDRLPVVKHELMRRAMGI